ncbi:CRISPR-associated endonuclease Cas2 [uncultured Dubosiella sp.]|uniref:CRISPR-associated endonuclease Cas2 n=3 Tax=uncultured Dubosiella sp. TaxID=1937011 RepID=UPI00272F2A81|nr:CRISPR-associated endonuclease Cas2 [uncultured Dubosiella sp.]
MSYRYMRVMVMYDLPAVTAKEKKIHHDFQKLLVQSGFLMMQESIYCKLAQNQQAADAIIKQLKKQLPDKGLVQVLTITEKQFAKIEYLVGKKVSEVIDTDDRVVIL